MQIKLGRTALMPDKNNLFTVCLPINWIMSLSPVSGLSYAPSLVPKLGPVAELRWIYTLAPEKNGFSQRGPHLIGSKKGTRPRIQNWKTPKRFSPSPLSV